MSSVRVTVRLFAIAVLLAGYGGLASKVALAGTAAGTWRTENSGTGKTLYAVACLSASRCEAVGAAGTILATGNGGRTWRAQASPLRGSSKILYQIACAAPSSCYVIARPDTILVTHNGGATWSRHVLPLGGGQGLTDQACLGAFTPATRGRPALCRLGLLDIACVSARVCYAVASEPAAYDTTPLTSKPRAAPPPSSVWVTRDGGASWARQQVPSGVACDCGSGVFHYPLEWVSCLSSGLCRAGGGHFLGCGHCGFAYAVLASAGPGRPWKLLSCPASATSCTTFSPDAGECPTSLRCYGVYSTSPFDDGNIVYRSADGGLAWQGGPSGSSSMRAGLACPAARTCYTVGSHGTITRTANGTTFASEASPTARDLNGIGCVGATTCYAVGAKGTILARR
jgi:photosystem II stability/assembly factor-like uncharacterized protein